MTPGRQRRCAAILRRHWDDEVEIEIYPDAYHAFDLPMSRRAAFTGADGELRVSGANPEARKKSQEHMLAFFATHLGPAN